MDERDELQQRLLDALETAVDEVLNRGMVVGDSILGAELAQKFSPTEDGLFRTVDWESIQQITELEQVDLMHRLARHQQMVWWQEEEADPA